MLRVQTHAQNMKYLLLFARQLWLRERSSMLRYMYIACVAAKRTVQR
jgi:hypothetical protein